VYFSFLQYLYNLRVQLEHPVLPQHEIETRAGSHLPTRNEMEKFEKIILIKKGSYSFEEDKIITRNWKTFCEVSMQDKLSICIIIFRNIF
jgi:hypothetical protein